jgi:ubiquinone/menaquinone biosynthesis C-methylase UbiE
LVFNKIILIIVSQRSFSTETEKFIDGIEFSYKGQGMSVNEEKHIKEAFTELAPNYFQTMDRELIQYWGISYPTFVDRLVRVASVKKGEKVLDIATGTAVIPLKLSSMSRDPDRVVGLDITAAMLAQGRKAIARNCAVNAIDLVCASATDMPFADGIFDVIICGLGTHHMNVPSMLADVKRLLAKNGRLIISDVGATPFWRSLAGKALLWLLMWQYGLANRSARSKAEVEAFGNVRTAGEWHRLLSDFGFTKIHINEIKPRFPWFPCGLTLQAETTR